MHTRSNKIAAYKPFNLRAHKWNIFAYFLYYIVEWLSYYRKRKAKEVEDKIRKIRVSPTYGIACNENSCSTAKCSIFHSLSSFNAVHSKHSLFCIVKACTAHMECKGESIESKSMKLDFQTAKKQWRVSNGDSTCTIHSKPHSFQSHIKLLNKSIYRSIDFDDPGTIKKLLIWYKPRI